MLLICLLAACEPSKEELKKSYAKTCNEQADANYPDGEMRAAMHDFCDCCADKVVEKFSSKELTEFNQLERAGKKAEVAAKLMPVLQPCTVEMQKRMEHIDTTVAPVPSAN